MDFWRFDCNVPQVWCEMKLYVVGNGDVLPENAHDLIFTDTDLVGVDMSCIPNRVTWLLVYNAKEAIEIIKTGWAKVISVGDSSWEEILKFMEPLLETDGLAIVPKIEYHGFNPVVAEAIRLFSNKWETRYSG